MSDKKKKKKGGNGSTKEKKGNDSINSAQTIEYLEAKVLDLNEKYTRFKTKHDILAKENELLSRSQLKFNSDKQDIVEFLNIKVGQHEKLIASLEEKIKKLEEENKSLEFKAQHEIDTLTSTSKQEIENLTNQCAKFKAELTELTSFAALKADMEKKIIIYEESLQKKEAEHRSNVHNLEKKVLQNKNQIKREMIQKVNEAVGNFRRVADQQMAETTKRALRENVAITSQLRKMSSKSLDLIQENKVLSQKVAKLTNLNSILGQTELELAKKNQSNQAIIKMLVEKLRESDKMLEFAIESIPVNSETSDLGTERNVANSEYISELTKEVEALEDKNNVLNDSLADIAEISAKINFTIQDTMNGAMNEPLIKAVRATLLELIHKIGVSTGYDIDTRTLEDETNLILETFGIYQDLKQELSITLDAEIKEMKSVYCQTLPLPFGPPVTAKYILGEIRPWGSCATTLPKKGAGLYLAKPLNPPKLESLNNPKLLEK